MDCNNTSQIYELLLQILSVILNSLVPTILQAIRQYYDKEPYHTSILRGQDWVQELLNGHPKWIHTELGVHKHIFIALIAELRAIGYVCGLQIHNIRRTISHFSIWLRYWVVSPSSQRVISEIE